MRCGSGVGGKDNCIHDAQDPNEHVGAKRGTCGRFPTNPVRRGQAVSLSASAGGGRLIAEKGAGAGCDADEPAQVEVS